MDNNKEIALYQQDNKDEIILYQPDDSIRLDVWVEFDTVWLTHKTPAKWRAENME